MLTRITLRFSKKDKFKLNTQQNISLINFFKSNSTFITKYRHKSVKLFFNKFHFFYYQ